MIDTGRYEASIMRAFIGVEFSREIRDRMIDIQSMIRGNSICGRWKYIDNFHLTLKFLGEITYEQADGIYANMKNRLADCQGFNVKAWGLGCFKGEGCLRVVFLKVHDEEDKLENLFKAVESSCIEARIPREKRKYTPHITLAQDVKLECSFDELSEKEPAVQHIDIPVKEVSIIMSEQRQGKRVYTPIRTVSLT